jgi:hypothetical protein
MAKLKFEINRDILIQRYCVDGSTLDIIGDELGCSAKTVMKRLVDYDIPRRRSGPDTNCAIKTISISREALESYYINQELTFTEIGKQLGCSGRGIAMYAKKLGIVARSGRKGYGEIGGWYWGQLKENARRRGFEVGLTVRDGWGLFIQQERRCAISGLKLEFSTWQRKRDTTASLDRIDSKLGYILGNIQWVHKVINTMKMDMENLEFIAYCIMIAQKHPV